MALPNPSPRTPYLIVKNKNRKEWLANRRLGGSDICTLLNVPFSKHGQPHSSPYNLYYEKIADPRFKPDNEKMRRRFMAGHAMEPAIAKEAKQFLPEGTHLEDPGNYTVFHDRRRPWLTCTPDRLIYNEDGTLWGPLSLKTVDYFAVSDWNGKHPSRYSSVQLHAEMSILNCKQGMIAAWVGLTGVRFMVYTVERNEKLVQLIRRKAKEFQKHIDTKKPPSIDGLPATTRALDKLTPIGDGSKEIELGPDFIKLWSDYDEASTALKYMESRKQAAANAFKEAMGDAEVAHIEGCPKAATWQTIKRKAYKVKAGSYRKFDFVNEKET